MNTKSSLSGLSTKLACLFAFILIINASSAQTNVSGGIYANTTWTLAGSPYILSDTVVIFANIKVTIQPGVMVKFNNNALIEAWGSLSAIGTAADSIIFTSNSATPYAGIYNGITTTPNSDTISFRYCRFSYADVAFGNNQENFNDPALSHCYFVSDLTGVEIPGYGSSFDTCTFKHDSTGVTAAGIFGYVSGCLFKQNSTGIDAQFGGTITSIVNSTFLNNNNAIKEVANADITHCTLDSNTTALTSSLRDTITNCIVKYNGTGLNCEDDYLASNDISNNNIGIISNNGCTIEMNTISNNYIGIETNDDIIHCNTICNNSHYNIVAEMADNEIASNNYWCLPDSAHIQATIYDAYQNINYGFVFFTPFDTVPCIYITGAAVQNLSSTSEDVKLYPNPNNGSFTIQSSVISDQSSVEIYNMLGEKVYSQFSTFNSPLSIELKQPSGAYLYRIVSEKGNLIGAGKFVVE